jgi:uncharacterized protein YfaT (DUF1175 family)
MTDDKIRAIAAKVGYGKHYNNPEIPIIRVLVDMCKDWMVGQDDKYIRVDSFVHCLKRIMAKRLDDLICDKYALLFATPEDKLEAFYAAFCERGE